MKTDRTSITRKPDRARYDRETLYEILDEAPICTVAFVRDGSPIAIPTIHARLDDTVYLHGSTGSGMLQSIAGAEICVTATIIDGLVLARSVFNHSMNYRSAVVLGRAREVTEKAEKERAFRAIVDHVLEGRWDEARQPTAKEAAQTKIIALPIEEASAKVRTGPPIDELEDRDLPIWSGVIPLRTTYGDPIAESPDLQTPASVSALRAR
jgi:uncharacterized protein